MGRKSTRENKTAYQIAREKRGLTIEKAGELMDGITSDRIAKLENGSVHVQPEDVVLMAECYKAPELCNYYCTHECAIGEKTVEEIEVKSLSQIAIETLNSLNKMTRLKDRLLEIVEDGRVRPDESDDFLIIKSTLDKIAASVNALQLWVDGQIADGKDQMVNNNENDFQRMSETNYTWPAQVDATHQKTLETVIEAFLAII